MIEMLEVVSIAGGEGARRRLDVPVEAYVPASGAVTDREVPLFASLRSTMGLPHSNPCWWPERPTRRRYGVVPPGAASPDRAPAPVVPLARTTSGLGRGFAVPSVALLEKTLAGLRAWDTGRQELAVASAG